MLNLEKNQKLVLLFVRENRVEASKIITIIF